jgi:glycosidase
MVYYGDEAGMWGGDDPCDRWPMVWEDLTYEPQTADPRGRERTPDAVAFDRKLFDFYQAAIALRDKHPVFRRGSFETEAADDDAKFFAFRRRLGEEEAVVLFNRGDTPHAWRAAFGEVNFDVALRSDDGEDVITTPDGRGYLLQVPPLTAVVLVSQTPEQ